MDEEKRYINQPSSSSPPFRESPPVVTFVYFTRVDRPSSKVETHITHPSRSSHRRHQHLLSSPEHRTTDLAASQTRSDLDPLFPHQRKKIATYPIAYHLVTRDIPSSHSEEATRSSTSNAKGSSTFDCSYFWTGLLGEWRRVVRADGVHIEGRASASSFPTSPFTTVISSCSLISLHSITCYSLCLSGPPPRPKPL